MTVVRLRQIGIDLLRWHRWNLTLLLLMLRPISRKNTFPFRLIAYIKKHTHLLFEASRAGVCFKIKQAVLNIISLRAGRVHRGPNSHEILLIWWYFMSLLPPTVARRWIVCLQRWSNAATQGKKKTAYSWNRELSFIYCYVTLPTHLDLWNWI